MASGFESMRRLQKAADSAQAEQGVSLPFPFSILPASSSPL